MSCAVSCHVYISLNALLRRDDVMCHDHVVWCEINCVCEWSRDGCSSQYLETFKTRGNILISHLHTTLNSAMIASGKCSSKTMLPHSNILTLQKFVLDAWSLTFFENFTLDIFYCLCESKLPPPSPAARRDYPEKCPLVFSRLRRSYLLFSRVCVNDCCIVPW